jgi:hypothetical protein
MHCDSNTSHFFREAACRSYGDTVQHSFTIGLHSLLFQLILYHFLSIFTNVLSNYAYTFHTYIHTSVLTHTHTHTHNNGSNSQRRLPNAASSLCLPTLSSVRYTSPPQTFFIQYSSQITLYRLISFYLHRARAHFVLSGLLFYYHLSNCCYTTLSSFGHRLLSVT